MTDNSGCPAEEILAAVLGTFFGTLLFCVVLALLLIMVYRRRQQRLMTAQRIAGYISFQSQPSPTWGTCAPGVFPLRSLRMRMLPDSLISWFSFLSFSPPPFSLSNPLLPSNPLSLSNLSVSLYLWDVLCSTVTKVCPRVDKETHPLGKALVLEQLLLIKPNTQIQCFSSIQNNNNNNNTIYKAPYIFLFSQ